MKRRGRPLPHVFEFGDFRLDGDGDCLVQPRWRRVPLTPKAFDTLVYLVEHAGTVLGKDELMRAVWPDTASKRTISIKTSRSCAARSGSIAATIATSPPSRDAATSLSRRSRIAAADAGAARTDCRRVDRGAAVRECQRRSRVRFLRRRPRRRIDHRAVEAGAACASWRGPRRSRSRGRKPTSGEIADKLGVNLVLEGTVRKSGLGSESRRN